MSIDKLTGINDEQKNLPELNKILEWLDKKKWGIRYVTTTPTASTMNVGELVIDDLLDRGYILTPDGTLMSFNASIGGLTSSNILVDLDGDTYITPEETSDDDTLRFYSVDTQLVTMNNSTGMIIDTTVDINSTTQMDGTLTVGVNDTGHDVKLFGATSGSYMLWDESADDLSLIASSLSVDAGEKINVESFGGDTYMTYNSGTTYWEFYVDGYKRIEM